MGVIIALLFIIALIVIIKNFGSKFIDKKTSENVGFLFKVVGVILALFILLTLWLILSNK